MPHRPALVNGFQHGSLGALQEAAMLNLPAFRFVSLAFVGALVIPVLGCDGGGSSGTAGAGGDGGSGGVATVGGGGEGGSAGGAGGGGGSTGGAGGTGGMPMGMALTSPEITEGGMVPVAYSCAGKNISPQLDWTGAPLGAQSFSVIFEDESNALIHWGIWNIPADATGLPTNVETTKNPANVPGSQQAISYDQQTYGYLGPCPGGNLHTYRFTVYALDVATLPLAGIGTKESAKELSIEHELASASLSAQSDAQP
jgi:Raf kinase inhibitor-like YbhB/YbcL family protein